MKEESLTLKVVAPLHGMGPRQNKRGRREDLSVQHPLSLLPDQHRGPQLTPCLPPHNRWYGPRLWTLSPNKPTLSLFYVRCLATATDRRARTKVTIKSSQILSKKQKRPVRDTSGNCCSEIFHPCNNFINWVNHGLLWRLHNKLQPMNKC